ncbi:hypothetical protein [Mesorhizobium sp. SP-1A]|uniref:hypothetical protein n=1 Tax=Mesorhizobium sp. SP-1A TaxID=3077840 RepID=UPI0028F721C9|nr:hypothetical protein [Mesorhizobium sp. SP-1A]
MLKLALSGETWNGEALHNPLELLRNHANRTLKKRHRFNAFSESGYVWISPKEPDEDGIIAIYEEGARKFVGGISKHWIAVNEAHHGVGLGAELFIRAFDAMIKHPDTMNVGHKLTKAGRACLKKAHRIAIGRAIDNGFEVPNEVLADYPEFTVSPSI